MNIDYLFERIFIVCYDFDYPRSHDVTANDVTAMRINASFSFPTLPTAFIFRLISEI